MPSFWSNATRTPTWASTAKSLLAALLPMIGRTSAAAIAGSEARPAGGPARWRAGGQAGSLAIGPGLSSATGPGTARGPARHGGATAGDGHGSSRPRALWRIASTETVSGAMVYKIR